MNYNSTIKWIFSKLPMYQNIGAAAYKKDLKNILKLSRHLNNPNHNFKSIHIAGTNGKGSTAHMISSVLQEANYKVGLYTSPHLVDFRERIKINGKMIEKDFITDFIKDNIDFFDNNSFSFFELSVGLAFEYFNINSVDIAIIEAGMGGRLDSTNIISPQVSVITNISYDHTQFLGDTITKIAKEKAGIIKKGIPVIIGENKKEITDLFINIAKQKESEILFADKLIDKQYDCDLKGVYQKMNIKTSVQTINELVKLGFIISEENIVDGLKNIKTNTGILGRWEIIGRDPLIICDVAHNHEALSIVLNHLISMEYNKIHFVIGFVNDKNLNSIIDLFPMHAEFYFTKPNIERGMDQLELQNLFKSKNRIGNSFSNVKLALKSALNMSKKDDIIYVGGSTFVVAEAM
ncbi:MAG: bifunctional folylpolyglutamate synthase/dihydrofolate synthase [Flavobacteriaceae bacterium]|nr:bifunctional folylpolyglutamate synthase/dihydrofolate synthase [Flavobacteriaceae bacterium]MBT4113186.1 bifunctional folylpolyglutamate synthase/dihydrofolate synthase [Flavobacteriaceae bacterium]MBT4614665.1 bifunctional folylpolyglutamate synthase/dihydrofolate synthase [Flavobacteriaceae bacterium]MBT5245961.1 bifunctional folylpolyglutamate synthase/dihydrofolate synthase [Flavobacteriaceae bacterium]MBT5650566.1 bifunctional folylpolyglutamate synthase/dihydrofolate synthase [Flavoba